MTETPPLRWVGILATALYAITGVFPYLVSGLVVPAVALIILMFCWGIGLVFTARLGWTRPLLSLLGVPTALAFWWLFVTAGSELFGWTA